MYQNGICNVTGNVYNKMIRFSDISYQLSQDEMKQRIFAQYSSLLNSFDANVQLQLTFINYRMTAEELLDAAYEYTKEASDIVIEEFKNLQHEYFSFLDTQRQKGSNGIIRNKYLVFTIIDQSYDSAIRRLESIEANIKANFQSMGVVTEGLDGLERMSIINFLLNGNTQHYLELEYVPKETLKTYSLKDFIAPRSIDFSYKNDEFKLNNVKRHFIPSKIPNIFSNSYRYMIERS